MRDRWWILIGPLIALAVFVGGGYLIGELRTQTEESVTVQPVEDPEVYYKKGLRDGRDLDNDTLEELYKWIGYIGVAEKWDCQSISGGVTPQTVAPHTPREFATYLIEYLEGVDEGIDMTRSSFSQMEIQSFAPDAGERLAAHCALEPRDFIQFLREDTSFFETSSAQSISPQPASAQPSYYHRGYNDGRDLDAQTVAKIAQWHGYIQNYEKSGCVDNTGFERPEGYDSYILGVYDGLDEHWSAALTSGRDQLWDSSVMIGDGLARECALKLSSWEPKMRSYGTTFFD